MAIVICCVGVTFLGFAMELPYRVVSSATTSGTNDNYGVFMPYLSVQSQERPKDAAASLFPPKKPQNCYWMLLCSPLNCIPA